jgi:hypothetical protein
MYVLYLDFDGVLHHEDVRWSPKRGAYMSAPGEQLFAYVDLLDRQLRDLPDLRIVLSTSWTVRYGYSRTAARLPDSLRRRVIGSTWHSRMDKNLFYGTPRGLQVIQDLQRRKPTGWFALDDDDEGWPAWSRPYLVQTDGALGISAPNALTQIQAHIDRLNSAPERTHRE